MISHSMFRLVSSRVVTIFLPSISPHRTVHLVCLIIPSTLVLASITAAFARTDSATTMNCDELNMIENHKRKNEKKIENQDMYVQEGECASDVMISEQIYLISLERNNIK